MSVNFECQLFACGEKFRNSKEIIFYVKKHVREGFLMKCPFVDCLKSYKVVSSFTSHLSRQHHSLSIVTADSMQDGSKNSDERISLISPDRSFASSADDQTSAEAVDSSLQPVNLSQRYVSFLMSLQYQHLIPASTISKIVSAINALLECFQNQLKDSVKTSLETDYIASEVVWNVMQSSFSERNNPIAHLSVYTKYMRNNLFKSNFNVVLPTSYKVPISVTEFSSSECYQYVSILDSLQQLLPLNYVKEQFLHQNFQSNSVLSDYHDGAVFKNNMFFNTSQRIQIILYQDAFETVNPLGSARSCHKLLAVYFVLGNLYCFNRSKLNPMQ